MNESRMEGGKTAGKQLGFVLVCGHPLSLLSFLPLHNAEHALRFDRSHPSPPSVGLCERSTLARNERVLLLHA